MALLRIEGKTAGPFEEIRSIPEIERDTHVSLALVGVARHFRCETGANCDSGNISTVVVNRRSYFINHGLTNKLTLRSEFGLHYPQFVIAFSDNVTPTVARTSYQSYVLEARMHQHPLYRALKGLPRAVIQSLNPKEVRHFMTSMPQATSRCSLSEKEGSSTLRFHVKFLQGHAPRLGPL